MHIYIHVPFCARRCSYCDFAIAVRKQVPSDAYLAAVLREWQLWQADPAWEVSPEIETVYLGGGTPSRLAPPAVARLLDAIAADRPVVAGAEVTLEANPDDVTLAGAQAWRDAGVNRISLGVQSFDPRVLQWMHRTHTAEQVPRAVNSIRCASIGDLSVDLIFGLPAASQRDWSGDLERVLALHPDHVSLYGLTVEAHTPLGRWTVRGEVTPVDEETYAAEFLTADQALTERGFHHYEVSNAAKPGHRARHNSAYWRRVPFIGLGPAAHSGFASERRWNVREWAAYERIVAAGKSPLEGRELLDDGAIALEDLYLSLRTSDGVDLERVAPEVRLRWERAGWANASEGRLRLTAEGWLRLDALVSSLQA